MSQVSNLGKKTFLPRNIKQLEKFWEFGTALESNYLKYPVTPSIRNDL